MSATLNMILGDPVRRANLERRFWVKVDRRRPDECWPWLKPAKNGYGIFSLSSTRTTNAHRVAWALRNGPIRERTIIRHSCDNPACCNPAHLVPGTQLDNVSKGDEGVRFSKVAGPRGRR